MKKVILNLKGLLLCSIIATSIFSCSDDTKDDISTPVTEVKISESSKEIAINETYQIMAKVLPEDATNKTLTFESSDNEIATVSSVGLVQAIKSGQATITVKSENNKEAKITISVAESEKLIGKWDGKKLAYILSSGEKSVDDLITVFSTVPADETAEKKAEREATLKNLIGNKEFMEERWNAEVLENGTGVVHYEGKAADWDDKITKWERNGLDEDGNAKYIFNYGEGDYAVECTLILTEENKGFFTIGPDNVLKIYIERM